MAGTKTEPKTTSRTCTLCNGSGWIEELDGPRYSTFAGRCARCNGAGSIEQAPRKADPEGDAELDRWMAEARP